MINRLLMQLLAGAGVIVIISLLWMSAATARAERDLAEANYATVMAANQSVHASLRAERAERERIEEVLERRIDLSRRIQAEAASRLRTQEQEIARLRAENEAVEDYLSVPVPAELLDHYRMLTERRGGADGDN